MMPEEETISAHAGPVPTVPFVQWSMGAIEIRWRKSALLIVLKKFLRFKKMYIMDISENIHGKIQYAELLYEYSLLLVTTCNNDLSTGSSAN
jgi:hypothetical protein